MQVAYWIFTANFQLPLFLYERVLFIFVYYWVGNDNEELVHLAGILFVLKIFSWILVDCHNYFGAWFGMPLNEDGWNAILCVYRFWIGAY